MEGIADFLDSLIGGVDLTFYSMAIGGMLWGLFVLKPWDRETRYNDELLNKTVALIYLGTSALVITELAKIILKIWLMTATLDHWPFPALAHTAQFQAGLTRALLAGMLAFYIKNHLLPNVRSKEFWQRANLLMLPMVISGAWLVHGASRLDDRSLLMSLSVLHSVSAAAWVGSIFQLLLIWRLKKQNQITAEIWPILLWRFSPMGMAAVLGILASGLPIALYYFDTWNAFIGTGYGNLLLVKILMLIIALGFAVLNRQAVHDYFLTSNTHNINYRVPYYIEAETLVLITLLFTAASLV